MPESWLGASPWQKRWGAPIMESCCNAPSQCSWGLRAGQRPGHPAGRTVHTQELPFPGCQPQIQSQRCQGSVLNAPRVAHARATRQWGCNVTKIHIFAFGTCLRSLAPSFLRFHSVLVMRYVPLEFPILFIGFCGLLDLVAHYLD